METSLFFADLTKIICTLIVLYILCRFLTSGFKNKKIAAIAFVPLGIISVLALCQNLASERGESVAIILLASGIAIVILLFLMVTTFGNLILANIIGNAIYDVLKGAFRILLSLSSATIKLFRRRP